MEKTIMKDKMELKELVDTFSVYADKKDISAQVTLFTEDATVKTYVGGQLVAELIGRNQIRDSFTKFLDNFDTVYHCNGQQVVNINGDKATGTAYCLVTLIGDTEGKRVMRTQGVSYEDEYARVSNRWLIANRTTTFVLVDTKEI